jgi:Transposase
MWGACFSDMPGASWGGGVGVGLKGVCLAEPSNAVPTPLIRHVLSVDGIVGGSRVAHQFVGVDPHKRSVTVAVVDAVGGQLAAASFANSSSGMEEVAGWLQAAAPAVLRVGVEGSSGHGRHLAERLVAAGYDVREVTPRRTPERRRARRTPKTDYHDAYAIARAVAGEPRLGPVKPGAGLGEAHDELVIVRDHRDLLVQRQSRYHQPARDYLARKRSEGHSAKPAVPTRPCWGRRVIRRMWADRRRQLDHLTPEAA